MAVNGAKLYQNGNLETDINYSAIGKNSEVIAAGDVLTVASGLVKVVSAATDPILGVAAKTATMASDNQTVAKITPGYIPAENSVFFMYTNGDMTGNATDVGTYYGLTGATGAVVVNQSSGVTTTTSKQVEIVRVDPRNIGGTGAGSGLREVLVKFVRTPSTISNA